MPDLVRVGVLRKDEKDLSDDERRLILKMFRGKSVEFVPMHSRDYLEHSDKCRELGTTLVLLPKDKPIPSKAMDEGVPHVAVINGVLMRLLPLKPEFEIFTGGGWSY